MRGRSSSDSLTRLSGSFFPTIRATSVMVGLDPTIHAVQYGPAVDSHTSSSKFRAAEPCGSRTGQPWTRSEDLVPAGTPRAARHPRTRSGDLVPAGTPRAARHPRTRSEDLVPAGTPRVELRQHPQAFLPATQATKPARPAPAGSATNSRNRSAATAPAESRHPASPRPRCSAHTGTAAAGTPPAAPAPPHPPAPPSA